MAGEVKSVAQALADIKASIEVMRSRIGVLEANAAATPTPTPSQTIVTPTISGPSPLAVGNSVTLDSGSITGWTKGAVKLLNNGSEIATVTSNVYTLVASGQLAMSVEYTRNGASMVLRSPAVTVNAVTVPQPTVALSGAVTNNEGNSGTTAYTYTLTLTRNGSTAAYPYTYSVTGSGTNPANATDFGGTLPSGSGTFAAGETTKTITILVTGDNMFEPTETFTLSATVSGVATVTSTGTITNDDVAPSPTVGISAAVTNTEGNSGSVTYLYTLTLTRNGSTSAYPFTWSVAGSGTNPADAADFGGSFPSGSGTFASGETSKTITILATGDATIEPTETFTVSATVTGVGTVTQTGTITNDDVSSSGGPTIAASNPSEPAGSPRTNYATSSSAAAVFSKGTGTDASLFTVTDLGFGRCLHSISSSAAKGTYTLNLVATAAGASTTLAIVYTIGDALAAPASQGAQDIETFNGTAGTRLSALSGWTGSRGVDNGGVPLTSSVEYQLDGNGNLFGGDQGNAGANASTSPDFTGRWVAYRTAPVADVKGAVFEQDLSYDANTTGQNALFTLMVSDYQNLIQFKISKFNLPSAEARWQVFARKRINGVQSQLACLAMNGSDGQLTDEAQYPRFGGTAEGNESSITLVYAVSPDGSRVRIFNKGNPDNAWVEYDLTGVTLTNKYGFSSTYNKYDGIDDQNHRVVKEIRFVKSVGVLKILDAPLYSQDNTVLHNFTWDKLKPTYLQHRVKGASTWITGEIVSITGTTSGTGVYKANVSAAGSQRLEFRYLNDITTTADAPDATIFLARLRAATFGMNEQKSVYYVPGPMMTDLGYYATINGPGSANYDVSVPYGGVPVGDYEITTTNSVSALGSTSGNASVVLKSTNPTTRKHVVTLYEDLASNLRGVRFDGYTGNVTVKPIGVTDEVNAAWVKTKVSGPYMRNLDMGGGNQMPAPGRSTTLSTNTGMFPNQRIKDDDSTNENYRFETWENQCKAMTALVNYHNKTGFLYNVIPCDADDARVRAQAIVWRDQLPANCQVGFEIGNECIAFEGGVGTAAIYYMERMSLLTGLYGDGNQPPITTVINANEEGNDGFASQYFNAAGSLVICNIYGSGTTVLRAKKDAPIGSPMSLNNEFWETYLTHGALYNGRHRWHAKRLAEIDAIYRDVFGSAYSDRVYCLLMGFSARGPDQFDFHKANTACWNAVRAIGHDGYLMLDGSGTQNATNHTPSSIAATIRAAAVPRFANLRSMAKWIISQGKEIVLYETGLHSAYFGGASQQYKDTWFDLVRSDLGYDLEKECTDMLKQIPGLMFDYSKGADTIWGLFENNNQNVLDAPRAQGFMASLGIGPAISKSALVPFANWDMGRFGRISVPNFPATALDNRAASVRQATAGAPLLVAPDSSHRPRVIIQSDNRRGIQAADGTGYLQLDLDNSQFTNGYTMIIVMSGTPLAGEGLFAMGAGQSSSREYVGLASDGSWAYGSSTVSQTGSGITPRSDGKRSVLIVRVKRQSDGSTQLDMRMSGKTWTQSLPAVQYNVGALNRMIIGRSVLDYTKKSGMVIHQVKLLNSAISDADVLGEETHLNTKWETANIGIVASSATVTSATAYSQPGTTRRYYQVKGTRPITSIAAGTGSDAANVLIANASAGVFSVSDAALTNGSAQLTRTLPLVVTFDDNSTVNHTVTVTMQTIEASQLQSQVSAASFAGASGTTLSSLSGWSMYGSGATNQYTTDGNGSLIKLSGGQDQKFSAYTAPFTLAGSDVVLSVVPRETTGGTAIAAVPVFGKDANNWLGILVAIRPYDQTHGGGSNPSVSFQMAYMKAGTMTYYQNAVTAPDNTNHIGPARIDTRGAEHTITFRFSSDGTTLTIIPAWNPTAVTVHNIDPTLLGSLVGFGHDGYGQNQIDSVGNKVTSFVAQKLLGSLNFVNTTKIASDGPTFTSNLTTTGTVPSKLMHRTRASGQTTYGPWLVGDTTVTGSNIQYVATAPETTVDVQYAKYNDTAQMATTGGIILNNLNAEPSLWGVNTDVTALYYIGSMMMEDVGFYASVAPQTEVNNTWISIPYVGLLGEYTIRNTDGSPIPNLKLTGPALGGNGGNTLQVLESNPTTGVHRINVTGDSTANLRGFIFDRTVGYPPTSLSILPSGKTRTDVRTDWVKTHLGPFVRDLNTRGANQVTMTSTNSCMYTDVNGPVNVDGALARESETIQNQCRGMNALVSYYAKRGEWWHTIPYDADDTAIRRHAVIQRDMLTTNCDILLEGGNEVVGFPNGFTTIPRACWDSHKNGTYGNGSQTAYPATTLIQMTNADGDIFEAAGNYNNDIVNANYSMGATVFMNVFGIGFCLLRAKKNITKGTNFGGDPRVSNANWEILADNASSMAGKDRELLKFNKRIIAIYKDVFGSSYTARCKPVLMGWSAGGTEQWDIFRADTAYFADVVYMGDGGYLMFDDQGTQTQANPTAQQIVDAMRLNFANNLAAAKARSLFILGLGKRQRKYETGLHSAYWFGGATQGYRTAWNDGVEQTSLGYQMEYDITQALDQLPGRKYQFQGIGVTWGLRHHVSTPDNDVYANRFRGHRDARIADGTWTS
jgi:hypothetical protein